MSKLTSEERSAILSARAKNRKAAIALTNGGVALPKGIAKKMADLETWYNTVLAPAQKAEKAEEAA